MRRRGRVAFAVAVVVLASSCAGSQARARGSAGVLRLGVFASLTHAVAQVGLGSGIFRRDLAPTRVEVSTFTSGTEAAVGLLSGSIDAAYLGPWPTASLYLRSHEVSVVCGSAVGGVSFVVRRGAGISSPADLRGKRIAVPNVGNSQDIALRSWLRSNGLETTDEGGDVTVVERDPRELLQLFRIGRLDGAWVPEPYPTYLVDSGVAVRFLDEASLWPQGRFVTANLVVSSVYLRAHPGVVRRLIQANVDAIRLIRSNPAAAERIATRQLDALGAPAMPPSVVDAAWREISFNWAVVPSSMQRVSEEAYALGLLSDPPAGVLGVYRLDALNSVLDDDGLPRVPVPVDAEVS